MEGASELTKSACRSANLPGLEQVIDAPTGNIFPVRYSSEHMLQPPQTETRTLEEASPPPCIFNTPRPFGTVHVPPHMEQVQHTNTKTAK